MNCNLELIGHGPRGYRHKCRRPECGQEYRSHYADPALISIPCRAGDSEPRPELPEMPPITTQIGNYFGSMAKYLLLDRGVSLPELIQYRLDICVNTCEKYHPVYKACAACGCGVSDNPNPGANKLAQPKATCPIGKWKAVSRQANPEESK